MIEPPQILLVEDEQSVITHLTDMIDKIGFSKPQVAGSQEEAKNIVKRYRPDIALVDLSLGNNEDGQTTARMLSEEYQLPVVYLSSQSEKDQRYRAQPPYDYVLKPVDRKNLKKTIMLALSRHSQVDNLSLLVGDLPIPSILVSMESLEVLVCNSMFTELFPGIKSQEILSGFQNSSADVSREITRLVLQIKQQQKPVVNEVQLHTDTGYLDFKIYGKRVDSNAHPAILLSLVNITQNKSEDLILRKQENTFFNLFNKTPVMLLQLDACGKVLHANQKWLLSTGYSKDEVHQQSLQSFLANNSDNIFESEILPSLMGNKSEYNGHLEARDKNGDINSYQVHFSAMSDSDENKTFISAFVLIPTDLVVQKSQEEENTLANALRDTAEALTSTLNFDEVLDRILINVGEVVPCEAANVMMVWSGVAYIVRSTGYAELGLEEKMMSLQIPIAQESHYLSMSETGMPLAVADIQEYAALGSLSGINWARSMASAPLRSKGQVFGFLNLESSQPGFYQQKHADRLQAFADQAAVAIENARLYAEVQQYAITDELTDIYNRRGLFELGRREVERARRYGRSLSAVMIDTDEFKTINDTYSHAVGDHTLRVMADRWKASIREVDLLGRYGGDEFVILLPETELASAIQVADRLRIAICGKKIESAVGDLSLSVSVGVAELTEDITTFDALIEKADQAMFMAKSSGKNQVRN